MFFIRIIYISLIGFLSILTGGHSRFLTSIHNNEDPLGHIRDLETFQKVSQNLMPHNSDTENPSRYVDAFYEFDDYFPTDFEKQNVNNSPNPVEDGRSELTPYVKSNISEFELDEDQKSLGSPTADGIVPPTNSVVKPDSGDLCKGYLDSFVSSDIPAHALKIFIYNLDNPDKSLDPGIQTFLKNCQKLSIDDFKRSLADILLETIGVEKIFPKVHRLMYLLHLFTLGNPNFLEDVKMTLSEKHNFRMNVSEIFQRLKSIADLGYTRFNPEKYSPLWVVALDLIKATEEVLDIISVYDKDTRKPTIPALKARFSDKSYFVRENIVRFIDFDYSRLFEDIQLDCERKILGRIRDHEKLRGEILPVLSHSSRFYKISPHDIEEAIKLGMNDCNDSHFLERKNDEREERFFELANDEALDTHGRNIYFVISVAIRDAKTRKITRNTYYFRPIRGSEDN